MSTRQPFFNKVLIANRGEIACRIIRSAQTLGIQTLAIYTPLDALAQHTVMADACYPLPTPRGYLDGAHIIQLAKQHQADCIHPGYGFLSEDADFAQACQDAGITFIGPCPNTLRIWGDKHIAREAITAANVPCLPGCLLNPSSAKKRRTAVQEIGLPCILKAAHGGGGRGMQVIYKLAELEAAYTMIKRQVGGHIVAEHYLTHPRHIEVQVAGDHHGTYMHLYERDCSIQRRYQKIIEEAPASCLSAKQRKHLYQLALRAMHTHPYTGLATVEFLYDGKLFFFIEVNPRIQVEHPVTEMITGVDLVALQFKLAARQSLRNLLPEITCHGHAIQVRICAEDPNHDFMPTTGCLQAVSFPNTQENIRVDSGICAQDKVNPTYDSLLAKLIVHGPSRDQAISTLTTQLAHCQITGINHNLLFLKKLVQHPDWVHNTLHRDFLSLHASAVIPQYNTMLWYVLCAACAYRLHQLASTPPLPTLFMGWRLYSSPCINLTVWYEQKLHTIPAIPLDNDWEIILDGFPIVLSAYHQKEHQLCVTINQQPLQLSLYEQQEGVTMQYHDQQYVLYWEVPPQQKSIQTIPDSETISAPLPSTVTTLPVKVGQCVEPNDLLITLEAMKLEHPIRATHSRKIAKINCKVGDMVAKDTILIYFEKTDGVATHHGTEGKAISSNPQ